MGDDQKLRIFGLVSPIEWALRETDPNEVSLQPFMDYSVVTPLGLLRAGTKVPSCPSPAQAFPMKVRGHLWFSTETLCLRPLTGGDIPEGGITVFPVHLLRQLRYMSRQVTLPRRVVVSFRGEFSDFGKDLPDLGGDVTELGFVTRDYLLANRLTTDVFG